MCAGIFKDNCFGELSWTPTRREKEKSAAESESFACDDHIPVDEPFTTMRMKTVDSDFEAQIFDLRSSRASDTSLTGTIGLPEGRCDGKLSLKGYDEYPKLPRRSLLPITMVKLFLTSKAMELGAVKKGNFGLESAYVRRRVVWPIGRGRWNGWLLAIIVHVLLYYVPSLGKCRYHGK